MGDTKDRNSIRNKIFIGKIAWCLIQTVVLVLGAIGSYFLGVWLVVKSGGDNFIAPMLFVLIWMFSFVGLKFWVEDEFSDCIDSD